MAWEYRQFPVQPDAAPLCGNGDIILTDQANELREALRRRAETIGVTISLPEPVEDLETCYFSWLAAMRSAIEELIYAGQYGTFTRQYIEPYWTPLAWTPWTKATLLAKVHADFLDNALVTDPEDWMAATDADSKLDGHENLVGCPVFHESDDQDDQVSGYEFIRGLSRHSLDDDGKFHVSLIDEGGGAYRIRLYKYAARVGYQLAYTQPFNTPGAKYLIPASYSVTGEIVVDCIVGQDTDISVQVEYDRSVMYADHMNELYYALELLCYLPLADHPSITPASADAAYGYGEGPGPEFDGDSMMAAYEEGWDSFEAGGYSPSWADVYAQANSQLYWDAWGQKHCFDVGDYRVRQVNLAIPARLYPAVELIAPFYMHAEADNYFDIPERLECFLGADFSGGLVTAMFGDVERDGYGWGWHFLGWLAWGGEWPGGVQPLSYRWRQIERYNWGVPAVHEALLYGGLEPFGLYGGFAFGESGGPAYRNGAWDPIGSGEWWLLRPW